MKRDYGLEARFPRLSRGGAENLLLWVPTFIGAALGLAFGLTRFILLIRENLRMEPSSLAATLFLALMVGGVALLITLVSAAIGFGLGAMLQLGCRFWWAKKILTRS